MIQYCLYKKYPHFSLSPQVLRIKLNAQPAFVRAKQCVAHWYEINGLGVTNAERLIMVISQHYYTDLSAQLLLSNSKSNKALCFDQREFTELLSKILIYQGVR